MKNLIVFGITFIIFNIALAQNDQIVLEINNKPIYKKEFLQIFLKNNSNPKFDKASIDEYLELYKKFKLKVSEAEALGYDTIIKLKRELEGYRKTLANSYLIDKEENNKLVEEAYTRLKTEIRASHILINLKSNNPKDTLLAYEKITELRNRILKGEDFNKIAKEFSEDPSAQYNQGDLGFFTAFQMVYPFEDAAYKLEKDQISDIIKTRFGYHIIKLTDQRPARGIMKASHIMISVKKDASKNEIETAKKKIDEIYAELVKGGSFEDLAQKYSEDPGSSDKGGKLPEFGSGTSTRMVTEFEDQAFLLTDNGSFSKPFQTDFGFHIVKRINHTPLASFEDLKKELQNKVNKDERSKKTQQSFIKKLKTEYDYRLVSKKSIKWFTKNIDSTYSIGKWNYNKLNTNKVIFTLDSKEFTQKMFGEFLMNNYKNAPKNIKSDFIEKQFNNWVSYEVLKYEDSKLESKYPEFKALMQEYHDGVLLYEIMTDKIWNKASKDTLGLKQFYENNINKYQWKKRIDATIYECQTNDIAKKVLKMLQSSDTINSKHIIEKINATSELNLKVKMNKYEIDELPYLSNVEIKKGINQIIQYNGKFYVLKISEIIPPCPKTIKEAKGLIVSDYQNHLEKIWIEELYKKYNFKIVDNVIYNLGN
jgi:peptidyl-prolyl cis-trans isomerase SurA